MRLERECNTLKGMIYDMNKKVENKYLFCLSTHREHTILLSRETVNKVNKGTNSSPVVISFILREFTGKAAAYKSCVTL